MNAKKLVMLLAVVAIAVGVWFMMGGKDADCPECCPMVENAETGEMEMQDPNCKCSDCDASDDNSGDDNSGDDNSGDDNSGDDNSGDDNSGDDNSGDDNSGDDSSGDDM